MRETLCHSICGQSSWLTDPSRPRYVTVVTYMGVCVCTRLRWTVSQVCVCVFRDYRSASARMMTELTPVKRGQNINAMAHGYFEPSSSSCLWLRHACVCTPSLKGPCTWNLTCIQIQTSFTVWMYVSVQAGWNHRESLHLCLGFSPKMHDHIIISPQNSGSHEWSWLQNPEVYPLN